MWNQLSHWISVFQWNSEQRFKSSTDPAVRAVDLKLPCYKVPVEINKVKENYATGTVQDLVASRYKDEEYAMGSSSSTQIVFKCDLGLFQCVKEAWANHWNLRTTPEDWWFPVACRIAKAIDKAAKSGSSKVREHFVAHKGKETIEIEQDVGSIYDMDVVSLFSSISFALEMRTKVPTYATCMQNDFSTTTPAQKIASQINLMASMDEFFEYKFTGTGMCICGIKGLEMLGEQADWEKLVEKLRQVREELKPILSSIHLSNDWFDHVEFVFTNLAKTYSDPGSYKVRSFWSNVLVEDFEKEYSMEESCIPGRTRILGVKEIPEYNGWLIQFLLDSTKIRKRDLSDRTTRDKLSCLNSVPMTVSLTGVQPNVSAKATLEAGIMGFRVLEPSETFNQVPSVKPHHMWAMMLPTNSPLFRY